MNSVAVPSCPSRRARSNRLPRILGFGCRDVALHRFMSQREMREKKGKKKWRERGSRGRGKGRREEKREGRDEEKKEEGEKEEKEGEEEEEKKGRKRRR